MSKNMNHRIVHKSRKLEIPNNYQRGLYLSSGQGAFHFTPASHNKIPAQNT